MQGEEKSGAELAGGRRTDRCQMPCSQWDARRPGSEDVRVIGPLLRFRLLRPRGTRFGGLTEPVLSLQWKRPSWCRREATDYRLARRSPAPRPLPRERAPSSPASRAPRGPTTRHHLVHVLLAAHNKAVLLPDIPRFIVVVDSDSLSEFS